MRELKEHLSSLPSGTITDSGKIEELLAPIWEDLAGTEAGMQGYKLHGRMEQVDWSAPNLTFRIDRHGGLCQGSTRAEVQCWRVNIDESSAVLEGTTHRQIKPMSPRFYARSKAEEIVAAIRADNDDVEYLKWTGKDMVTVLVTKVVPTGSEFTQTLQGRRKRLREELGKLMPLGGWMPHEKRDTFVRSSE